MSHDPIDCVFSTSGSGPPLYLVHGIGSRRSGWNGVIKTLDTVYECVSYDLRGHGDSPASELPFGLDDLVADLEALRARLGHEKIHIVGHSLGGMIGPAYAQAHPDRTLSLGLFSTAAFRTADDSEKVKAVVARMRAQGVENVLPTLIDRWFTEGFIDAHRDLVDARIQQVVDTPENVFLQVFDIYANTEMSPWIGEVLAPCLVLTGENDGGCNPRLNRQIDAALRHSELVILEDLKHSILIEAPDQVAAHVADFLARVSP